MHVYAIYHIVFSRLKRTFKYFFIMLLTVLVCMMGFVDKQSMLSSDDPHYLIVKQTILKYEEMHSKNRNHLLQS